MQDQKNVTTVKRKKRKDHHIMWPINAANPDEAFYFPKESRIAGYIQEFESTNYHLYKDKRAALIKTIDEILNQPSAENAQQKAAKFVLMAAGIWKKTACTFNRVDTPYSALDFTKCSELCAFLTDPKRCTEKVLKQSWLPDFLPSMLDFPQ